MSSIVGIHKVLKTFYTFSGLQLNCEKYELFSTGISREKLLEIHQISGFKLGTLPVKYLGVPLVTRRLNDKDCVPLVERITTRINHWASKMLSYAGRLQLIQSVIYSIQNYWCRHFMLPKSVLKKISQTCAHFFWQGNSTNSKGARVSWQAICYPKAEGGLGLKDVVSWNHACMLHHLRSIFAKAGSLWIAWLYAYVLKGRSVW